MNNFFSAVCLATAAFSLAACMDDTPEAVVGAATPAVFISASDGVTATMNISQAGKVQGVELFFEYRTACENDNYASLTSPTGRKTIVMNRGLNRCGGATQTWSSSNAELGDSFVGSQAAGAWQFNIRDLDGNKYAGTLREVWLMVKIKTPDGLVSVRSEVTGLPVAIPNPAP